ncbi:hypothetical protein [Sedimenticola selenatireducens]|uniref:Lytic murein transglycosylase n=1 Tax=Sedimenticola selenatireducens TaxID=191960 RepID=A0A557SJS8_9GAMM|nr:hypothetical protein [Sedimenticola selenatireducens]TVO77686.1 hypothetical protein FHP88_02480 [Sedimenticola selenatireducens]TVT64992.1 MAG: hypothetical protein FHK78_04845 [Sedimenticola selenatireducens]
MDRKILLSILAISLIALAAAILLPGGRTVNENPKLPWIVQIDSQGKLSVFGITLGESTLEQARESFQDQGKANLFLTPENRYVVEVYFQRLYLSGIRADIVLNMELPEMLAKQMFERGERISKMGNGTRKVELSNEDMATLANERIRYITYLPAVDLEELLIAKRFGEPESKASEPESTITHWLYPSKGMDIAVNPEGKEVIQYVNPSDYSKVLKPLQLSN